MLAGLSTAGSDPEVATVYYGEGASAGAAGDLADTIRKRFEGVEVEVCDGGQPHYPYIVSLE